MVLEDNYSGWPGRASSRENRDDTVRLIVFAAWAEEKELDDDVKSY